MKIFIRRKELEKLLPLEDACEGIAFDERDVELIDAPKPPPPAVVNVSPQVHFPEPVLSRREEVWVRAWVHCASASNSTSAKIATNWADTCLDAFDKKFNK